MLLGVQIINFDVFDDDRCGALLDDADGQRLRGLSALIGRNNTGKSCFFNAMSFFKRAVTDNVARASIKDGRPGFSNLVQQKGKPAVFKLLFRLRGKVYIQYELTLDATPFGSPYVAAECALLSEKKDDGYEVTKIIDLQNGSGNIRQSGKMTHIDITDEHITALNLLGRIAGFPELVLLYREIERWFFCSFSVDETNTYYSDGNAPGGHKHLTGHGSNVVNVLEYMKTTDPEGYEKTLEDIRSKIPSMKKKKNLPAELKQSPNKLFLYLLLFRDSDPHSTIFIETPDNDLYHDMVDVLADEMREFTINNPYSQIIFTTHNPYILETISPKEIWIFSRQFGEEDDNVTIRCAGDDPLVSEMFRQGVGMGAIWYGGHLDDEEG